MTERERETEMDRQIHLQSKREGDRVKEREMRYYGERDR